MGLRLGSFPMIIRSSGGGGGGGGGGGERRWWSTAAVDDDVEQQRRTTEAVAVNSFVGREQRCWPTEVVDRGGGRRSQEWLPRAFFWKVLGRLEGAERALEDQGTHQRTNDGVSQLTEKCQKLSPRPASCHPHKTTLFVFVGAIRHFSRRSK